MRGLEPKYRCEANGHALSGKEKFCPIDGSQLIPTHGQPRMKSPPSAGFWNQYRAAPRIVKYGLPVVVIVIILAANGGSSNSKKTASSSSAASVVCGTGTRLNGDRCVAAARKTRVVVHTHTVTQTITVTTPAAQSAAPVASTPTPPAAVAPSVEDVGSLSHDTDAEFCSAHECIESFSSGNGAVVQCADGEYSHSGGLSGACSDHGGEE